MSPVVDCPQRDTIDRHQRWDRFDRADRFEHSIEWKAQGVSQRQGATQLPVPRTTLQAWRTWPDTRDICPHVAQFFQSGPGLAFLPRLVRACHLVCVEVGACGSRLVCLFLSLPGLDRCVAASYGAQQQVTRQVEDAIVTYRPADSARLATDMPRQDSTLTQDETFPGGLCLVGAEPVSTSIILEQLAQAREPATWNARMAPALAELNCQVMHSTRDEAPGLLAYVAPALEAPHSPDVFHVQQEIGKAVCAPMATTGRAAHKATPEAHERLVPGQALLHTAGNTSPEHGAGRPPQEAVNLAQAPQVLEAARRAHERLAQQREQGAQHLRAIGQASHGVDLQRGVRRTGQLLADDIHEQMAHVRAIAQHEALRQTCLDRRDTAGRVIPNMRATIEFVSGYGGQQVQHLALTPPVSSALPAQRMPSYDLDRVAQTQTVNEGTPLRELAERLRAPLCAPGGTLSQLRPEAQGQLHQKAKTLAEVFQRSSAHVEGRNGSLSLRNHQLRGLDLPRKRECLTAIHNFFLTRPDRTTAAERFFAQKPRAMFAAILESVELTPPPLSPPRRP